MKSDYNFHGKFVDGYYGRGPDDPSIQLQLKHENDHVKPMMNSAEGYQYIRLEFGSIEAFDEFADYVARLRKVMKIE